MEILLHIVDSLFSFHFSQDKGLSVALMMEQRSDSDDGNGGDQERDDNGRRLGNGGNANSGLTAYLQNLRDQQQLPTHSAPPLPDEGQTECQQSQSQTVSTQGQSPQPGPSGLQSLIQGIVGGASANSGGVASQQSSAGAMPSLVCPRACSLFLVCMDLGGHELPAHMLQWIQEDMNCQPTCSSGFRRE